MSGHKDKNEYFCYYSTWKLGDLLVLLKVIKDPFTMDDLEIAQQISKVDKYVERVLIKTKTT